MKFERFENDPEVQKALLPLIEKAKAKELRVSDVIQEQADMNLQYVDVVMQGGGVLGVALLGYIYALEEMGIRFLSIGGASAGSIVALLLMACDEKENKKAKILTEIIAAKSFQDFIDGDDDATDLSNLIGEGDLSNHKAKAVFKGMQAIDNLCFDLGLNPGKTFLEWIDSLLKEFGVPTLKLLNKRVAQNPDGLQNKSPYNHDKDIGCNIRIVAADVTTETKVIFPDMADVYWKDPESISPANFVRASMSIPFFFHPYRVKGLKEIPKAKQVWQDSFKGEMPDEVTFMDGGIMSNFPISIFHQWETVPIAPTFGIRLGNKKRTFQKIDGVASLLSAIFNSSRHCADYDFLMQNHDYQQLIGYIDTDKYEWLDFNMKDETKLELFRAGVVSACNFVQKFEWEKYREFRKKQLDSISK